MKLKYHVSRNTILSPNILIDRIILVLKEQEYTIKNRTDNSVSFEDDNWQIRSKLKIFKKVDAGKFEIISSANGQLITFTYYLSFLPEIIITAIIAIMGIIQDFYNS